MPMPLDGSALSLEGQLIGQMDTGKAVLTDDCGLTTTSEKAITDSENDICKSKNVADRHRATTSPTTSSSVAFMRCDSWSSTKAILRGNFGAVKINPSPTVILSSSNNTSPTTSSSTKMTTPSSSMGGMNSNAKASFFNTEAFEDDEDDEESLLSFVSGVATGIASSECSFNNNDDEVKSDVSVCEIFNPVDVVTASSNSSAPDNCTKDVVSTAAPIAAVIADTPTPHATAPPTPTPSQQFRPSNTTPKMMTRMPAPLRQSRPPLLPADPTTKYRKIMKTYGFAAIHHICFATLYKDHQRYVSVLAKADPTLTPSPFPFSKELATQQRSMGAPM